MNRKKIFFLVILIILISSLIIVLINKIDDDQKGKIEKEEAFEYTEDISNSNEITELKYPNIAWYIYDVFNQLGNNAYSDKVMLNILDEEYLKYYSLDENNISDITSKYINKKYDIEKIEYAATYDNEMYVCFVTCSSGEKFILKYSSISNKYKIYLDNYLNDVGYENFVNNELLDILDNSYVQGNKYNYVESIAYEPNTVVLKYYEMLKNYDFEYIYTNFVSDETKSKYSYDKLNLLYSNEESYFNSNVLNSVDYIPTDDGFRIYSYKDSLLNEYKISENGYFNFKIDINISEWN